MESDQRNQPNPIYQGVPFQIERQGPMQNVNPVPLGPQVSAVPLNYGIRVPLLQRYPPQGYPPQGYSPQAFPPQFIPFQSAYRSYKSQCPLMCIGIYLIFQLIFYLFFISDSNYLFNYCDWEFSLNQITVMNEASPEFGDGTYSIKDFYNNFCQKNLDYWDCPDFCQSIEPLKTSGQYAITYGIVSLIVGAAAFGLGLLKAIYKVDKIKKWMLYVINIMPLYLFVIGLYLYTSESKFNEHFSSNWNHIKVRWGWWIPFLLILLFSSSAMLSMCAFRIF